MDNSICRNDRLKLASLSSVASVMMFSLLAGCEPPSEPRFLEVERELSGLDSEPFVAAMGQPKVAASRLLAAMIDRPEATYFLKAMGPVPQMESVAPAFQEIVQSLSFDGPQPLNWKLPDGWTQAAGGADFRLATLTGPDGAQIAVTSLTAGQNLLDNINRWQGQIGLPPISEADVDVKRIEVHGQEVILYDQTGMGTSNSMVPPFARASSSAPSTSTPPTDASSSTDNSEAPNLAIGLPQATDPWKVLPPVGSKLVRRQKSTEQGELNFELLKFPAGPEFLSMLNVWAPTIGATPIDADALQANVRDVSIGDQTGQWFVLQSDEGKGNERMVVVRLVVGDDAWYFKWFGPTAVLDGETQSMEQFLKEVVFP